MASKGTVLVTGGTGYIGSFTVLALIQAGYKVIIIDNLYNSSDEVLNRIEHLAGTKPQLYNVDITDKAAIDKVFAAHPDIESVIHFAALKAVGESSEIPLDYWRVNVGGTLNLLKSMEEHNVNNIVFSSSATVYGNPAVIPIPETLLVKAYNPYGHTKVANEEMITAQINALRKKASKNGKSPDSYNAALLRYFNPVGAHPEGIMGEDPQGVPFNLLPLAAQVATGKRSHLAVFGTDWEESRDKTCIRDYLHILDLANGHLLAMKYLSEKKPGVKAWNLGTGTGSTVLEVIEAFNSAIGRKLPVKYEPRRDGDVPNLTAKNDLARQELGWVPQHTLQDACEDLWLWTENNPQGYREPLSKELLAKLDKAKAELKKKRAARK